MESKLGGRIIHEMTLHYDVKSIDDLKRHVREHPYEPKTRKLWWYNIGEKRYQKIKDFLQEEGAV